MKSVSESNIKDTDVILFLYATQGKFWMFQTHRGNHLTGDQGNAYPK
jgi:hypothetical protein